MTEIARLEGVPPNMSVNSTTPAAVLNARHGAEDVGAALLHVVFGADRDRSRIALRPDHMLQSGAKTGRQLAVGHEDHSNHQKSIALSARGARPPRQRLTLFKGRHFCALRRIIQAK